MNYLSLKVQALCKQLFPNGRAFWIPPGTPGSGEVLVTEDGSETIVDEDSFFIVTEDWTPADGGTFDSFLTSFNGDGSGRIGTTEKLLSDSGSLLDHTLADNDNFTDGTDDPDNNDCDLWEGNLGLRQYGVTSWSTPTRLERMATIRTKMAYPGTSAPRLTAQHLQNELQAAGFDVYVFENLFSPGGIAKSPGEILGVDVGMAAYGMFGYGELGYGDTYSLSGVSIIADYIDPVRDLGFVVDSTYRGMFYITGPTIDSFATVPATRQTEFRQMVFRLKSQHLAAYLFITFTT